jgi:hypothetical protein
MPWAELRGLLLAYIRHRYTDYEARLAAGEDALFDQNRVKTNFTTFHDGVPLERRQRGNSLLQRLIANMSVLRTNSL